MCTEEYHMLKLLDDVAFQGLNASTLPSNIKLYNALAVTMVEYGRKLLSSPAAAAGEPVDHFANEVSLNMLRYLDRLLALPSEQRLRYFRKSAKNTVTAYRIKHNRDAYIHQFEDDNFWCHIPAETDPEQNLICRERIAKFFACMAAELTPLEFVCFFCPTVFGTKPRELEVLLQSSKDALMNRLTAYLADYYRVSPSVFNMILKRNPIKNDITARAITQAALRAKAKLRIVLHENISSAQ